MSSSPDKSNIIGRNFKKSSPNIIQEHNEEGMLEYLSVDEAEIIS